MNIQIRRVDDGNIFTGKDYSDIKDLGEVTHIICELESIKLELLEIFNKMNKEDDGVKEE